MNSWKQAQDGMRYRMAHGLWLARMLSAAREGRDFSEREPLIADYMNDEIGGSAVLPADWSGPTPVKKR